MTMTSMTIKSLESRASKLPSLQSIRSGYVKYQSTGRCVAATCQEGHHICGINEFCKLNSRLLPTPPRGQGRDRRAEGPCEGVSRLGFSLFSLISSLLSLFSPLLFSPPPPSSPLFPLFSLVSGVCNGSCPLSVALSPPLSYSPPRLSSTRGSECVDATLVSW